MKKILLFVATAVVVLLAGVLIFGAFQPETYHVERSMTMTSSPATVYRIISDLKRYHEWSPWEKLDPDMKRDIVGAPGEVGAYYAWDGNSDVGAGKMSIVTATPSERIDIKLEFFRPFASTSNTSWVLSKDDGKTKMTWSMDGKNEGVVAKTFSIFVDMDKLIGKDFEQGLAQLKTLAESESF